MLKAMSLTQILWTDLLYNAGKLGIIAQLLYCAA